MRVLPHFSIPLKDPALGNLFLRVGGLVLVAWGIKVIFWGAAERRDRGWEEHGNFISVEIGGREESEPMSLCSRLLWGPVWIAAGVLLLVYLPW